MIIILMGVSGSGKTTVGQWLAQMLGWQFVEGDDFHPKRNLEKMSNGIPLTDADRQPWLMKLRHKIEQFQTKEESAVIACSALKHSYREILQGQNRDAIKLVFLDVARDTVRSRLEQRQGHFMKAQMLDSQFATLEVPEDAITIRLDRFESVEQIGAEIHRCLWG